MLNQSLNDNQKFDTLCVFLQSSSSSNQNFQQFLQDQCSHFFKDLNLPSKSIIFDVQKEYQFADMKTFDWTEENRDLNQKIFYSQPFLQQQSYNMHETQKPSLCKRAKKSQKAGEYSKNYRQNKKEKMKALSEENYLLKKKIDELQSRLRQRELELNRIKFSNKHEEYNIQQLNEDVINKINLIADGQVNNAESINKMQKQQDVKKKLETEAFLNFYQMHGLGGQRTKQVLEYYVNEFLENVMRDRQKYHFLMCLKDKHLSPIKTALDTALNQAFPRTQEQQRQLHIAFDLMRPTIEQFRDRCQNFYRSSREVIKVLQRIHQATKMQFVSNIQQTKKRLKTALWFHVNQYRKQMRNTRAEWIDLVKNPQQSEQQQKSTKKKKAGKDLT